MPSCPSIDYDIDERYKPELCAGCVNCPQDQWGDTWLPSRNRSRMSEEDKAKSKREKQIKRSEKWLAEKRKKDAGAEDGDHGRNPFQPQTPKKESDGWDFLEPQTLEKDRGRSIDRAPEQPGRSSSTDSVRSDITVIHAPSSQPTKSQESEEQTSAPRPRRVKFVLPTLTTGPRSRSCSTHSHSESEDEIQEQTRKPRGRMNTTQTSTSHETDSSSHQAARIRAWSSTWKEKLREK